MGVVERLPGTSFKVERMPGDASQADFKLHKIALENSVVAMSVSATGEQSKGGYGDYGNREEDCQDKCFAVSCSRTSMQVSTSDEQDLLGGGRDCSSVFLSKSRGAADQFVS